MIKSSNKKHFKKDIHILKIQGNSKYCKQHGDSNCEDCYIFSPICTNKEILQNLNYRNRISRHNIFLLGKRGPIRYLILKEDPNVSNLCRFLFWASGAIYGNHLQAPSLPPPPQKKKVSSLFLPTFN